MSGCTPAVAAPSRARRRLSSLHDTATLDYGMREVREEGRGSEEEREEERKRKGKEEERKGKGKGKGKGGGEGGREI